MSGADLSGPPQNRPIASPEGAEGDVVDDGQEEVFSRTAVERGLVRDPNALDPDELARRPKSPGRIDRES